MSTKNKKTIGNRARSLSPRAQFIFNGVVAFVRDHVRIRKRKILVGRLLGHVGAEYWVLFARTDNPGRFGGCRLNHKYE